MLLHCMEQQGSLITLCDEMKLLCCGFTKSCRGFDVGFDEDMLLHCMEQQGSLITLCDGMKLLCCGFTEGFSVPW